MVRYFEGDEAAEGDELVAAVARLIGSTPTDPPARVRANADTPGTPPARGGSAPRASGCAAPSTCSSATARELVENLILAESTRSRRRRWPTCCRCSGRTSSAILEAMDGLPVTIRLIDPPLHEFLPDYTDLSVEVALHDDARPADDEGARAARAR